MIHHEVEGEGFALFLHTGGAGDLRMWRTAGYVDGLADYRIVLVDHRGRGRTPPADDLVLPRVRRFLADALA